MRSYTTIKLIRMTILDTLRSAAAPNETAPPITKVEVEESEAVTTLKDKKTPGVDNIQGELLKHGGGEVIEILHDICNKILKTGIWPEDWTTSVLIPIPKKRHLSVLTIEQLHLSVMLAKRC